MLAELGASEAPMPWKSNATPRAINSTAPLSVLLALLKRCSSLSHLNQIHARLLTIGLAAGFLPSRHSPNQLWNMLIQAYSKSPDPQASLHLFIRLLASDSVSPDKFTYTFVVTACSHFPTPETGETVHGKAVRSGFNSDVYVGNALVSFYSLFGRMSHARKLFDEIPLRDAVTWTSLVRGYVKNGELGVAKKVFDAMADRNDVTWAVMIAGCMEAGRYSEAVALFHDLLWRGDGVCPNEAILVCALSACAGLGALSQGEWIHSLIEQSAVRRTVNVSNALIDMYSKCGRLDCARQIFNGASERDVLTWTTMISGLAMHGLGKDALKVFEDMIKDGIAPDSITLLGVLNACSHSGIVDEGCSIFYSMTSSWGIIPEMEHYGCLIDLLGRAGQVDKAVAIALKMPMEPDIVIWRALLSACRVHRNMELGERVIEQLNRSSPGGGHALLSNLYASHGRWNDAAEARRRTSEQSPGCSWIEVAGEVHQFLASDRVHPRIVEIRAKLEEVLREGRTKGGYVVDTKRVLFDLSEEDGEQAIHWHSEKLALAFGLMTMESRGCIRIVKNLRICEDCHSAMKAISLAYGREIVIRDRTRFHSFTRGKCSCKDYW